VHPFGASLGTAILLAAFGWREAVMAVHTTKAFPAFVAAGMVTVLLILIFAIWGRHPRVGEHTVKLDLPAASTTH
jgi:hypothetical protein